MSLRYKDKTFCDINGKFYYKIIKKLDIVTEAMPSAYFC